MPALGTTSATYHDGLPDAAHASGCGMQALQQEKQTETLL